MYILLSLQLKQNQNTLKKVTKTIKKRLYAVINNNNNLIINNIWLYRISKRCAK